MYSKTLAKKIAKIILEKKGEDVDILNVGKVSNITNYFVICTGESENHNRAITDKIKEDLKKSGIPVHHIEGYKYGKWILIDFVDVIVHIFVRSTREYYALEHLWGDVEVESITE